MVMIKSDFAPPLVLRAPQGKSVGQLLAETAHGATNSAALGTVCAPLKGAATAAMVGLASSAPLRLCCLRALELPANTRMTQMAGTPMRALNPVAVQELLSMTCPSTISVLLILQTAA